VGTVIGSFLVRCGRRRSHRKEELDATHTLRIQRALVTVAESDIWQSVRKTEALLQR
jgi:hypothetical protein